MTLNIFTMVQDELASLDCRSIAPQEYIHVMGLAGECGEVVEPLKKFYRDGTPLNVADLTAELGDVLFYVNAIATDHGIDMAVVVRRLLKKLEDRRKWDLVKAKKDNA